MRRAAVLLLAVSTFALAGDLEAPRERLLKERLHDDLGAGLAGCVPTVLLEALCELEPGRFGKDVKQLYERFGYLSLEDDDLPVGVTEKRVLGVRIRNYNCLACHAGTEDGKLVVGAPNRTLDFTGFYEEVFAATVRSVDDECKPRAWTRLVAAARKARHLHHERLSAVEAASLVSFAEAIARRDLRRTSKNEFGPGRTVVTAAYRRLRFGMDPGPFAPVKPPDLFGVRARRSLLWTGNERYDPDVPAAERIARNGLLVPWVQVHPFLQKPVPDEVIVSRLDRHRRMADLLVEATPPPAPLPASRSLHERGRAVFEETCSRCHGTYRQEEALGRLVTTVASYDEKLVPVEKVGTDPAYDASQDDEFNRKVGATPIGRLYAATPTGHTYVARPLLGVRLRFPYLHNASVPSLRAMLTPPEQRPRAFWVGADAPLDDDACGYGRGEPRGPRAQERDTSIDGNRSTGHPFGTTLGEEEKKALLAYVRSL
jgi:hypothetical protein